LFVVCLVLMVFTILSGNKPISDQPGFCLFFSLNTSNTTQQTTNNKQQTTNNKQQTTNNNNNQQQQQQQTTTTRITKWHCKHLKCSLFFLQKAKGGRQELTKKAT